MKMRQSVLMLLTFSMILITSTGCAGKKVIFVPSGCNIQSVDKAIIDTKQNTDILEASKQCAKNYTKVKEENELLRAVIETCR